MKKIIVTLCLLFIMINVDAQCYRHHHHYRPRAYRPVVIINNYYHTPPPTTVLFYYEWRYVKVWDGYCYVWTQRRFRVYY